ncbi:MAG: CoB--CoM heterodisulfide reductase iron-sulfur subunit A family protein [Spirochaetaceae bacterium]|nr:MAG: CoB--CoM heterodisulfide reductase iron-sulfur subunit A family protein [Spirochaetaceae bacterium]
MNRDVLILGGGIAGIQTALLLAEKDHNVYVMDSAPAIGGFFPLLERTFPTNSCGICFMSPKPPAYCPIYENDFHQNITVLTDCDIKNVHGAAGDFTVAYESRPRYVDPGKCTLCMGCAEVCPVEVARELGGGLEKRKAIYLPFMQAIPRSFTVDMSACSRCGECRKVCQPGAIDFDQKTRTAELRVGAMVLGFGFEPNAASIKGEYGFGRYRNVLSSVQYERILSFSGPTMGMPLRPSDGGKIKKLAFIQCVGSRDISCGRGYCSSVCCRIATKQAMISKLRDRHVEAAIFYMDIRAMGKEYEKYYERSRQEYGVRYIRSAVSTIRELQRTKNLLITFASEGGELQSEEFDAVVLSVGFTTPSDVTKIADMLGVALNEYGFCRTEEFHPTRTSVPGIYVAGAFREPRDIPESVVDASSAAADVSELLDEFEPEGGGETEIDVQTPLLEEEELRIGVFVCDKHNLIKSELNLIELLGDLDLDRDIVRLKRVDFSVMEQGLQEVKNLIEEHSLNRVIIAGYRCLEINKFIKQHSEILGAYSNLISLANIGEQCANVHVDSPEAATKKAYALIRASIEKAKFEVPRRRGKKRLDSRVLVVGGGISGLSSALSLAEQGMKVTLVEKEAELGGNARFIYYTLKGFDVQHLVRDLVSSVQEHPKIEVLKNAELVGMEGTWGDFTSLIRKNGGHMELRHGAAVFAVGGKEIQPQGYLYGENPKVVTQRELERMIFCEQQKAAALQTVAMIQCVNCRNEQHPYCSRVCCIHAIKNALKLKEINPDISIYVFYRDIRTYGFYEEYYLQAREKGIIFIRYEQEEQPRVREGVGKLRVSAVEPLIGEAVEVEADLLALSNGIEPYHNPGLAEIAGLQTTPEGFFAEANPKSAPLDSIARGKFFCGICHSPNLLENVICQGKAAAARASVLLWGREGFFSDTQVYVNERLCSGCGVCVSACPFEARVVDPVRKKAVVKEDLCKGCGTCAVCCPNGASQQYDFERKAIIREMDRILV